MSTLCRYSQYFCSGLERFSFAGVLVLVLVVWKVLPSLEVDRLFALSRATVFQDVWCFTFLVKFFISSIGMTSNTTNKDSSCSFEWCVYHKSVLCFYLSGPEFDRSCWTSVKNDLGLDFPNVSNKGKYFHLFSTVVFDYVFISSCCFGVTVFESFFVKMFLAFSCLIILMVTSRSHKVMQ